VALVAVAASEPTCHADCNIERFLSEQTVPGFHVACFSLQDDECVSPGLPSSPPR
jgi:hypothetical protein